MSVGVVVPVHGWAAFLAEALDSVLAERPAAVIVVDDGSPEPVVLHPDHAPHVRLVRLDARAGPAAARNAGVDALGEHIDLVAFCDADDAWEPGSLARRVAALSAEPTAAGAFGRALIVGRDGRPTGEHWAEPPAGRYTDAAALYADNPVLTSSVVLRRTAFAGFDESFPVAEDWELWLRVLREHGPLVCVPGAVVRYRRHPGGLSARVLGLARAQRRLHERHADLVSPAVRDAALARDRAAEAAGLVRERRYAEARTLMRAGPRRGLLAVPGARAAAGRRAPYA